MKKQTHNERELGKAIKWLRKKSKRGYVLDLKDPHAIWHRQPARASAVDNPKVRRIK